MKPPAEEPDRSVAQQRLGTRLTIFNGVSCVVLVALIRATNNPLFAFPLLALSIPCALPCMLPAVGPATEEAMMLIAIALGLNSLVWGHGIAWILYRVGPKISKFFSASRSATLMDP